MRVVLRGVTPDGVLRMAFTESLALVLMGIAIGLPATFSTARLLSAKLFGVSAADPLTTALAVLALIALAAVATLVPARRASRCDPLLALRRE